MFYHTGFNPFQPPRPPPQPPAEPKKPAAPAGPPAPARMAIMVGGGKEAIIALPPNFDKAQQAAVQCFEIPNTFVPRLAVKGIPPWLQSYMDKGQDTLYIADDASYQYCIAGRQVVRFEIMAFEKSQPAAPAKPASAPPPGSSCPIDIICETTQGKAFQLLATAQTDKDLSKNPPVGTFTGTLRITNNPLKIEFVGKQA